MKFDDNGVYVAISDGVERQVPWSPFKKILSSVKETRRDMSKIPFGLRWLVKKAMKDMKDEEYAINALAQMIISVEGVGGKIDWSK